MPKEKIMTSKKIEIFSNKSAEEKRTKGFNVDKILFCIGNDILHIDNVYSTTTKGTYQDTDGKWWEHYEIALMLYVKCVEMLREIEKALLQLLHTIIITLLGVGFLTWLAMAFTGSV